MMPTIWRPNEPLTLTPPESARLSDDEDFLYNPWHRLDESSIPPEDLVKQIADSYKVPLPIRRNKQWVYTDS